MSRFEQLHKLLSINPDDVETHFMLAMEYKSIGDYSSAQGKFDDCLKLNPLYVTAYFQKANTYLAAGQRDEAKATLSEGIAVANDSGEEHAATKMQELLDNLSI